MYKVTMLYGLKGRSELAMLESYTCTVSRGSVGAGSTSWAKHVNFFGEGSQTRQFWPFGAKLQYFGGLCKVREYFEGFFLINLEPLNQISVQPLIFKHANIDNNLLVAASQKDEAENIFMPFS